MADQLDRILSEISSLEGALGADRDILNVALKHLRETRVRLNAQAEAVKSVRDLRTFPSVAVVLTEALGHMAKLCAEVIPGGLHRPTETTVNPSVESKPVTAEKTQETRKPASTPADGTKPEPPKPKGKKPTARKSTGRQKPIGVYPIAATILRVAFTSEESFDSLESVLQRVFGESWTTHKMPVLTGGGKSLMVSLSEDLQSPDGGHLRGLLSQTVDRLALIRTDASPKDRAISPRLRRLFDEIHADQRLDQITRDVKRWVTPNVN